MTETILGVLITLLVFYLGILEKRLSDMAAKLDKKINMEDMERVVELEIKTVSNEQSNLKEDLGRIETKVDKLLDKITKVFIN